VSTDPAPSLDPVATTARLTAAMRARESRRPDRLVDDPLAEVLAGEQGMAMLALADAGDTIPVRTRWIDDRITAAMAGAVGQVVILAAGMDTRAWRLAALTDVPLYELDRPELLDLKAGLLGDHPPRAARTALGVDLTGPWTDALGAAGHDPSLPTCWLVEGLLQYLPEPDVARLLDRVTSLSAPGSHLVTDIVGAALLAALRHTPMLTRFAELGMPWVFGSDDPEGLLAPRGWVTTVAAFGDVTRALGRTAPGEVGPDGYLVHATR
jgi:methyltransferase (TIGR00027 family)